MIRKTIGFSYGFIKCEKLSVLKSYNDIEIQGFSYQKSSRNKRRKKIWMNY